MPPHLPLCSSGIQTSHRCLCLEAMGGQQSPGAGTPHPQAPGHPTNPASRQQEAGASPDQNPESQGSLATCLARANPIPTHQAAWRLAQKVLKHIHNSLDALSQVGTGVSTTHLGYAVATPQTTSGSRRLQENPMHRTLGRGGGPPSWRLGKSDSCHAHPLQAWPSRLVSSLCQASAFRFLAVNICLLSPSSLTSS